MPALNSLRAFEAAARRASFAGAAEELGVTPGAIAHHVKALEAWAGQKLFKRNPQGIELTALGAGVLADFVAAFDRLGEAVHKLRTNAAPQEVRIAALPSIAQLWLSPRLPEIRRNLPSVSISVTALEQSPNMAREPFDLAIFFEDGCEQDNAMPIAKDVIFPVCAPDIADRLKAPADLTREVFLHDTAWANDWSIWLSRALPEMNPNRGGPTFSLYALAVEECKNGAGLLIGHANLVRAHLNSGVLVRPFDQEVVLDRCLQLRTAKPVAAGSSVESVVNGLLIDP